MMRTEIKLGGKGSEKKEDTGSDTIKVHAYTTADLEKIYREMDGEEIRGTSPRYVEEVAEGEEIPVVVKGPLSLSDMVAWAGGISWHRMGLAHGPKLRFLRDHPGLSYTDPQTGAPEPIANSHFDPDAARILMGSPLPLDLGFQRVAWLMPSSYQLDERPWVPQGIERSLKRLCTVRGYQLVSGKSGSNMA